MNSLHRTRRLLSQALITASMLGAPFAIASEPAHRLAPHAPKKTVVLVHGAFADGSCWDEVIRLLQADGVEVVAVQNPLSTLAGDAAAATRVINQQTRPVVLVGHSWGGMVITEAGVHPKVESLVYVAAFSPDVGLSVASMLQPYPAAPWLGQLVPDEVGQLTLSTKAFVTYFAQDLPLARAKALAAVQVPTYHGTLAEPATQTAWRGKPSWYVVAEQDHIIPPDLQRVMAARMNARVSTVPASHVVMISQPQQVVKAIHEALRHTPPR